MRRSIGATAVAVLLAGCPDDDERPPNLEWHVALEGLEGSILGFWGASASDLFAVGGTLGTDGGEALVLWHDGEAWHSLDVDAPTLWWAFGFSHDDVWMVGEKGTIVHYDGQEFTTIESGFTYTLWGVWGAEPDDLWTVGGSVLQDGPGILRHWDGETWLDETSFDTRDEMFFKVWGTGRNDVYVVGARGTILHYDGDTWARMTSPATDRLVTVAGRGSGDVWAVGGLGSSVLLHLEDGQWQDLDDPALVGGLMGVWTAPGEPVVLTGFRGLLAVGDESGFREQESPTDLCLHAAWGDGNGTYLAGGGDLIVPERAAGIVIASGTVAAGPVR